MHILVSQECICRRIHNDHYTWKLDVFPRFTVPRYQTFHTPHCTCFRSSQTDMHRASYQNHGQSRWIWSWDPGRRWVTNVSERSMRRREVARLYIGTGSARYECWPEQRAKLAWTLLLGARAVGGAWWSSGQRQPAAEDRGRRTRLHESSSSSSNGGRKSYQ